MKRSEMVQKLMNFVYDATECDIQIGPDEASLLLEFIEKAGMAPPCVDKDRVQAIMHVYYDSTFNRWDEDFDKDEKLVAAYKWRMSLK